MTHSSFNAPSTARSRSGRVAVILALALGSAATSQAAFILVDDFDSYTTGTAVNGGSNAFTNNGGPWTAWSGTGIITSGLVGITPASGDKYLLYGWGSGSRGAYLNTIPSIANNQEGAYYFQARRTATGGNVSYGLTDSTAPTSSFTDFNVEVSLVTSGSTFNLTAQNGAVTTTLATGLATNTWHDIWLYVNNATNTFDVYYGTTGNPNTLGTKVGDSLAFGNTTSNSLVTFATINTTNITNTSAQINNLYAVPEPSSATLLALALGVMVVRRRRN